MPSRPRELARADRVLPGVWRLRLPLPWPAVPHVNAYALAAGDGIVLVDTGIWEPGALAQLELALHQAGGVGLEHVKLLVCTHAHSDHYGLAGPIVDRAGCELWMHPHHAHQTRPAENPERAFERRYEVARQSGVPEAPLLAWAEARRDAPSTIERVVLPDRDLLPGVTVETDLGPLEVHETPGHAPSHVCLHQPDRGLLISGDHLLGRVSLFYDIGFSPDPVGEFLSSLDVVERLDAGLCIAGHGRPFRDIAAHIEANRALVAERLELVRGALEDRPRTAFETVPALLGERDLSPMMLNWGLSEVLAYLSHLEALGEAARAADGDGGVERWRVAGSRR